MDSVLVIKISPSFFQSSSLSIQLMFIVKTNQLDVQKNYCVKFCLVIFHVSDINRDLYLVRIKLTQVQIRFIKCYFVRIYHHQMLCIVMQARF